MRAVGKFMKGRRQAIWWAAFLVFLIADTAACREINPKVNASGKRLLPPVAAGIPIIYSAHNRGNIQLAIANNGTFGTLGGTIPDPFTGEAIPSCIYPKGSDIVYLWVAAVWIGAVVQRDTLVSCANEDWYRTLEFWPSTDFVYKSLDINSPYYDPDAYSEQDILCEYTDTVTSPNLVERDPTDNRPHKPLNVKVTQRSMAWSYSYADDFILFDFQVQNIGEKNLRDVYIGIYVDGDVHHTTEGGGYMDDIVGFYPTHPAPEECGFIDTVNIAYTIDNDGDPGESGHWDDHSVRGAVGVRVVRTPSTSLKYSYNWWITNYSDPTRDFGPRRRGTADDPYRYFGSRLGTPTGDRNKYYVLSHEEFDYDLLFTAVDHTSEGWLPPPKNAESIASGFDARYLLSFGPFDISPGQKLPVSFAWVGGENFHVNPSDYEDLFEDRRDPWPYYRSFDFSDLANNSLWASWVYDNPGVDTDGDGYFGPERICCDSITGICDTSYVAGDGVPDFRAAGPPPAPKLRVLPSEGKLIVRWNGFYSETTPDMFSRIIDFEGYRVHVGRDNRPASFSVVASYDREDYNRYRYEQSMGGSAEWVLEEIPFTVDSLRRMFGDPDFDPLLYTREKPFEFEGENYFFDAQDYNASSLSYVYGIHKVYPDAVKPGPDPSQWRPEDVTEEHGVPLPRFYEYQYIIDSLLPSVPYNVAVTCFDFGSPLVELTALETDPTNNTVVAYPQATADTVEAYGLDVYVYPNPYRIDGHYRALGFEGRLEPERPADRVRAIHFANLPAKCTISIYSLDGDLIKKIIHDKNPSGTLSSHNQWDLISHNNQAVVSGLYYYVVESEGRTQIGKLAIIK
jgi:hypothetical protein